MSYADVIKINESFRTSVNIEYDLLNENKLAQYIPTSDVCEVLGYFLSSVEDNKVNRATILEGPYGKGKSYLILSLLQILYMDEGNKNLLKFLDKVLLTDIGFANQIRRIKGKGIKLLPVVVNSNYSHLNQSLNIALKDALTRVGLDELFPNTAYDEALNIVSKWEKYVDINDKVLTECVNITGLKLKELKNGLSEYSKECYEKFIILYNCVNKTGQDFNPFSNNDVVKNYEDIAFKIKEHGYSGLFVVFDEFSKFIEADNNFLTTDLKILQDLSEKVSRSGDRQMHLCCITHKSLNSYYKNRKSDIANSLKTVEGRFKEIRFNRSLNQNYEIIAHTLDKLPGFDTVFENESKRNADYYVLNSELFNHTNEEVIKKGCFPLNPLSVYSAIQVSEMVAQNERTLFTLISDVDPNSLASFIRRNNEGLYNVDNIYDYFSNVFEKSDDEEIHALSYKTQTSLLRVEDELSIAIIKVIAIMKLINNFDGYAINDENISKSITCDVQMVKAKLNRLIEKWIIKKNFSNGCYDFALYGNKKINEQVNSLLNIKEKKIDIAATLNDLYPSSVLPRKYNAKHKMTRFYKQMYILASDLEKLKSFSVYFNQYACDGFIFKVIKNIDVELKRKFYCIKEHERVILKVPKRELPKSVIDEICRINLLKQLLVSKGISDEEKDEIRLIIEDETDELEEVLNEIYEGDELLIISNEEGKSYNEIISKVFENIYCISPLINNEMINKNSPISSQYLKPRNYVVELYLKEKAEDIDNKSDTSPESTVFYSIDPMEENTKAIINIIKNQLEISEYKKIVFADIYEKLVAPPYGVRKGVIPLLFAIAVNQMHANIIISYEKKEVPVSAETINKMIDKPDKYYIQLEKGNKGKTTYIKGLAEIFNIELTGIFTDDILNLSENIRNWIFGMPKVARCCSRKDNYLLLDEDILSIKDIFYGFDINSYEAIFKKLPYVYGDDYKKTIDFLKSWKKRISTRIVEFESNLANEVKKLLGAYSEASLYNSFSDFFRKNQVKDRYLDDKEKAIVSLFDENTYDDSACINGISLILFKIKITDWEKNHSEELLNYISSMLEMMPKRKMIVHREEICDVKEKELSRMAMLLKNQIINSFEEFNDAVDREEKAQILLQILKALTS